MARKENQMTNKYILQEDDCAPDAREYFDKTLVELTGLTCAQFKKEATKVATHDKMAIKWLYGEYLLEFYGDDPYHMLKRVEFPIVLYCRQCGKEFTVYSLTDYFDVTFYSGFCNQDCMNTYDKINFSCKDSNNDIPF